jgi:hypothetical protein
MAIFLDLTKQYDVINHNILLDKLNYYGIRGTVNSWFKSDLSHCVQFVEINQTDDKNNKQNMYLSLFREIMHGMPQR